MKGLFLKDCYLFMKRCRNMVILILFAVVVPLAVPNMSMFTFYPSLFISLIPITLIAYDTGDKWDQYASAMPFTKRDQVVEKYLFGLSLSLITMVLTVGAEMVAGAVRGEFDLMHYMELFAALVSISLLSPALMLPLVFIFGVEKGRIAYYVVVGGVSAVVIGMSSFSDGFSTLRQLGSSLGFMVPVLAVFLYLISIMLSIKFFGRGRK